MQNGITQANLTVLNALVSNFYENCVPQSGTFDTTTGFDSSCLGIPTQCNFGYFGTGGTDCQPCNCGANLGCNNEGVCQLPPSGYMAGLHGSYYYNTPASILKPTLWNFNPALYNWTGNTRQDRSGIQVYNNNTICSFTNYADNCAALCANDNTNCAWLCVWLCVCVCVCAPLLAFSGVRARVCACVFGCVRASPHKKTCCWPAYTPFPSPPSHTTPCTHLLNKKNNTAGCAQESFWTGARGALAQRQLSCAWRRRAHRPTKKTSSNTRGSLS